MYPIGRMTRRVADNFGDVAVAVAVKDHVHDHVHDDADGYVEGTARQGFLHSCA